MKNAGCANGKETITYLFNDWLNSFGVNGFRKRTFRRGRLTGATRM